MIRRLASKFVLEAFEGAPRDHKALIRYLDIYSANIAPENRTDSNELVSFLENPLTDRRIVYFGLKRDGVPCGFATAMYYGADATLIIDHMAINAGARSAGAFFEFVFLISDFLEEERIVPDYVVAEIMSRTQSVDGQVDPTQLVRLLKVIGFRVLQIPYIAPHFGIVDHPERYKSALMVIPRQPVTDIPVAECKKLVELIYFNHYLRWYEKAWTPTRLKPYRDRLQQCYEEITAKLEQLTFVKLNGSPLTESIFPSNAVAVHAANYLYVLLVAVPIALTVLFSMMQALWPAAIALGVTVIVLLVVFLVPTWRTNVVRFFRP